MKKLLILLHACLAGGFASAQSSTFLMGSNWDGSSEWSRHMDLGNGWYTDLTTLPGVASIMMGESTIDLAGQRYFHRTNLGITILHIGTGTIQSVLNPTVNFKGMEFNSNTGNLVGSYWNGSSEIFASLDPLTGAVTSLAAIGGVSGVAQGITSFDGAGNRYFMWTGSTIYVLDAASGSVLQTVPNSTLKNFEFNPNTGDLVGTVWTGTNEVYSTLDLGTGVISGLATITGVTGVVQGESAFDAANDRYFNRTNLGTMVYDGTTGSLIMSVPGMNIFKGMEYAGSLSGGGCSLNATLLSPSVLLAQKGSALTITATSNAPSAQLQWQSSPAGFGWMNVPAGPHYSGAGSPVLTINSVSLWNHDQPFRLIATAGNCSDTTEVTVIQISDTCLVTDTVRIFSGDTLTLDLASAGNDDLISLYPVPASHELVIDCSLFAEKEGNTVHITNSLGGEVLNTPVTTDITRLDIRLITQRGVYLLTVRNREGRPLAGRRFIVE
jgi:hypothetical protein